MQRFGNPAKNGSSVSVPSAATDTDESVGLRVRPTSPPVHVPCLHRAGRSIGRGWKRLERIVSNNLQRSVAVALVVAVSACANDPAHSSSSSAVGNPAGLQLILDHRHAPTDDLIEVFICDVPLPTSDPLYGDLPLRLPLTATTVAAELDDNVRPYFEALSHGLYHPHFRAGSILRITAAETHTDCVERALDSSSADAGAVLVVATAENLETQPGGWGRPGSPCASDFCPAAATRRAVYVGASDFHPDNGSVPLLDLIEHELGHTLDLPHSGDSGADQHASALDVMSNSAAPRDVQPGRRNAQDTIAVDRVALGWLPASDIRVAPSTGGLFDLAASTGSAGVRLLVLPVDRYSFLSVEYLPAEGFDDFLPAGGIAVHLIDQSAGACGRSSTGGSLCTGINRAQTTLGSPSPHLDLLDRSGASWVVGGWTVTVRRIDTTAQVEVHPTQR
jgi:hypothetical protein